MFKEVLCEVTDSNVGPKNRTIDIIANDRHTSEEFTLENLLEVTYAYNKNWNRFTSRFMNYGSGPDQ